MKSISLHVLSYYSHLHEVVSNFSDEQKREIREIGFGSLLDIRIKKFCPNLNLELLLNYNASGMMFSTKNGKVIFNKFTISDVLGLPVSDKPVEVIDDDTFRRKGSQVEAGSARRDWHRFLDISDPKKPYIAKKHWDDLFKKHQCGYDLKKLFVIFCLSKLLCPIADLGPALKCAKSSEDVSMISSYDWCGYILRSVCTAVLDCHQSIMMRKNELGQKKVTFKLWGCMIALALAVIHNFKCRNLDFSNVSKLFITCWQEEKELSSVVKQFEINMDFILPVKREKQKLQFKAPNVSAASRKSAFPTIKVVEGPSPSTRQLVMDLPHTLMTGEEIDALDVPEYVKNMHKLKRNALAFCQVNWDIAQNIREEGEKLSQYSISLDDSEVFNPEFLNQIDDICKRHLEAKDSANKVDPTIALLVKRTVDLEFERNESVPDLDVGVHGGEEKGGNDEKEPKEDDKKTRNADDDAGLQGDEEKGGNKDLDADVEKEPKEDDKKTRNADDDQLKEAKDKDKSSTSIPTPNARVELVDLSTPTPPPVVEVVENVYSRKSWRVDSSAKRKKIPDFSRPSFQLLTPSPVVEDVGFVDSVDSGEGVGSSIPIITPVKVKYPRVPEFLPFSYAMVSNGGPGNGWIELVLVEAKDLVGADFRGTSDPYVKVQYGNEMRRTKCDDSEDDSLNNLIDRIAKQGVDSEEPKKEEDEKKDIGDVAGVGSSSAPGVQAISVNNHGLILCRSLQQYNKYPSDLSPENVLLVDYLLYNEFDDVSLLALDP
ncbi:hypothetical protein BVRB_6g146070 [Beta vulgaris subsp. vulgaris]|nr:hypothetical protein BVRB_6g146070 [Beta vulgaris subsp. vulgaris]